MKQFKYKFRLRVKRVPDFFLAGMNEDTCRLLIENVGEKLSSMFLLLARVLSTKINLPKFKRINDLVINYQN